MMIIIIIAKPPLIKPSLCELPTIGGSSVPPCGTLHLLIGAFGIIIIIQSSILCCVASTYIILY